MNYTLNKTYPTSRVQQQNFFYATLLLDDYAGVLSEETLMHTYLYQYATQKQNFPDIAEALQQLAQTQMKHLSLLGETISLLGVDPKFRTINRQTKQETYWTSVNVNYEKGILAILNNNIAQVQQLIQQYQLHYRAIQDQNIRILLKRIIEDEQLHLQIFQYFLNQFQRKQ